MRNYELTFILGEEATESLAQAKIKDLTEQIEKLEGKVEKTEFWGKRELAYEIKHNRSGYYTTVWFSMPGVNSKVLEKNLRFDESILRSLITLAYTKATPGSLYPVIAEEKSASSDSKIESTSAEAELRLTSATKPKTTKKAKALEEADSDTDEERLEKLDAALGDILKDEE